MNKNNEITVNHERRLARPLKVLVPLIRRDIENAEHAGKMFKVSAGGKLAEAREQVKHGEWANWLEVNFHLSQSTARIWMEWWEHENRSTERFSTASEFRRATQPSYAKRRPIERDYQAPVERILSGITAKEMAERAVNAAKEHELERNLASKLINIGYKVLSIKLHPDKGGSHDAMRRLNKVRERLRQSYE